MLSKHLIKEEDVKGEKPSDICDMPEIKRRVAGTPRPHIGDFFKTKRRCIRCFHPIKC